MITQEKELVLNSLLTHLYIFKPEVKPKDWVILLHGWGVSASVLNQLAKFLVNNDYVVYLIDFPGFGKSPVPKKVLNLKDYVFLLKELIEKEIKDEVVILGHSFGGRVAIKFASNFPELVKKLILIDSAGFIKNDLKTKLFKFLSKIFKPLSRISIFSGIKIKIYRFLNTEDYLAYPELKETYKNIVSEDLTEELKKIKSATLIIWGEDDRTTPLKWGEKMHNLIYNSKFFKIKGGHFVFIDNHLETFLIIKNFLT